MRIAPESWLARPGIRRLLKALDADHGTARFVGGAVRDLLLGEQPGDLDLATTHPPDEVIRRLQDAGIKAIPTGIEHGTITAVSSNTVVEVTTLRADVSTDGRRATVAFTDDWQADASRRDFTINALYADPFTGDVQDYFGGRDDLEARIVRFIGEPLQRIAEDHLRILRYFRFHARYGQGDPDAAALQACTERANDLMALSRERIADELLKLLALDDPAPTIALMHRRGLFTPVVPEIVSVDRLPLLIRAEAQAGIAADPLRRFAALLPPDAAIAERVAARLKMSNKARKRLASAAGTDLGLNPRALAYRIGRPEAIDRLLLQDKPGEAAALRDWTVPRLPISGGQLMALGIDQGPVIARTLKLIEDRWVEEGFPTDDAFQTIVGDAVAAAQ